MTDSSATACACRRPLERGGAAACLSRGGRLDAGGVEAEITAEEYARLLGCPSTDVAGGALQELVRTTRSWYRRNGRPWLSCCELELSANSAGVRLGEWSFKTGRLGRELARAAAVRGVIVAVSAGPEVDAHASALWRAGRPDEAFFAESFGSAVAEYLLARVARELTEVAAPAGLVALPPECPGRGGWDIADQPALFSLLASRPALPGPLQVFASGMLAPTKSMLALVALAPATPANCAAVAGSPCDRCGLRACRYRRAPLPGARRRRPIARVAGIGSTHFPVFS